ncbi:MAG TPA: hypothetical protein VGB85_10535 [Nannocystis sp.]|jgi:hypothetical protein
MYLTVFMVPPSTLLTLLACWMTGAAIILGLFMLNRRRLLREHASE